MPTIKRVGPYRFFFYSNESDEPPHVHVERDRSTAKFWIAPVRYEHSRGLRAHQLMALRHLVEGLEAEIAQAWRDHFGH